MGIVDCRRWLGRAHWWMARALTGVLAAHPSLDLLSLLRGCAHTPSRQWRQPSSSLRATLRPKCGNSQNVCFNYRVQMFSGWKPQLECLSVPNSRSSGWWHLSWWRLQCCLTVGRLPFVSGVLPLAVIIFDISSSLGLKERGQMSALRVLTTDYVGADAWSQGCLSGLSHCFISFFVSQDCDGVRAGELQF